MSTTYEGADSYPNEITLVDDASDEDGASIDVPVEGLADRTRSLKESRNALANIAALTAIAAPPDGCVRHVQGKGLYVFKTAVTTGSAPFWFAADDATTGGWVSSTARRIQLVGVQSTKLVTTFLCTSTAYVDVTGLSLVVACEAGDILAIDAVLILLCLGACSAKVMIDDGGSVDPVEVIHQGSTINDGAVVDVRVGARAFHYVVANTGNVTIKVQAKYYASGGVTVVDVMGTAYTDSAGSSLRAMQFRG